MNVYPECISFKRIFENSGDPVSRKTEFSFKKYFSSELVELVNKKTNKLFNDISNLSDPADLYYMFYHDDVFIGGIQVYFIDGNTHLNFKHIGIDKELEKKYIDMVTVDLYKQNSVEYQTILLSLKKYSKKELINKFNELSGETLGEKYNRFYKKLLLDKLTNLIFHKIHN